MPLMIYLNDQSLINISFSSYLWLHFFQLFTIPFLSFIYVCICFPSFQDIQWYLAPLLLSWLTSPSTQYAWWCLGYSSSFRMTVTIWRQPCWSLFCPSWCLWGCWWWFQQRLQGDGSSSKLRMGSCELPVMFLCVALLKMVIVLWFYVGFWGEIKDKCGDIWLLCILIVLCTKIPTFKNQMTQTPKKNFCTSIFQPGSTRPHA